MRTKKRHRNHIDSRSEVQIDIDFCLKVCLEVVAACPGQGEKASIGQQNTTHTIKVR